MLVLMSFMNQSFLNKERREKKTHTKKERKNERENEYYLVVMLQLLLKGENTSISLFQIAENKSVIRRREKRQHLTSLVEREDFI